MLVTPKDDYDYSLANQEMLNDGRRGKNPFMAPEGMNSTMGRTGGSYNN